MKTNRIFALFLTGLLAAPVLRAQTPDPFAQLGEWQFGKSRQPLAEIEEQIRKTPPASYKEIEGKLLAVLKSPQTPKDAKRYICRWMTIVGSADCVPAVAELLTDPDLSHLARFALEPLKEPAAGAALRDALPKVKGKLLVGLISSIGVRRDPQAVSALSGLLHNSDPLVAEAAVSALGEVGSLEAVGVLNSAKLPPSLARPLARARVAAASRLATAGNAALATSIYRSLMQLQQPPAIQVAALKGLIGTLPTAEAVKLIVERVQGTDDAMRAATVAAYVSSTDQALQDAVAAQLPAIEVAGQEILLGVLADLANVNAREPLFKVVETGKSENVRAAAMLCLARHGQSADVAAIARLAGGDSRVVAEAARKTLQTMNRPGVDAALVQLIESPSASDRSVAVNALASRKADSALPTLERLVSGTDESIATEAAKALAVLGGTPQLQPISSVLLNTGNADLRKAAGAAARAICGRAPDKPAAAAPLLAALSRATTVPARISLIEPLSYTSGKEALAAVLQAMKDSSPEVRQAAASTLIEWPEADAVSHLVSLAKTTSDPAEAVKALRDGCLRLAQEEAIPLSQRTDIYRVVLETAKRPEEKRQALAGLAQLPSLKALEVAQGCVADAALKNDAASTVIRLARQMGAVYNRQSLAALQGLKAQNLEGPIAPQIDEAIKAVQNAGQSPEGFIVAWMLSGPYTEGVKDGGALFDVAFAPEQPDGNAEWRPVTVPPGGRAGLVELDKILKGNNRAAYLRTEIASDKEQDALLELGSDDGIKVWLNGKVVHANNATRPCSPGQDRARVRLKRGANPLLLKITQGGGEWAACCRVRSTDGKELGGITIAPNEQ